MWLILRVGAVLFFEVGIKLDIGYVSRLLWWLFALY